MNGFFTEEGIAIKTIYIPNLTISVSKEILCRYFSQFGAVYHAKVMSEPLKFYDLMKNLDAGRPSTSAVNHLPPDKYYAYVTFVNELGAADALRRYPHHIEGVEIEVEQAFTWNQPQKDVEQYLAANAQPSSSKKESMYEQMCTALDDDCIHEILGYLNVFELEEMSKYNQRLHGLAKQINVLNICRSSVDKIITLMQLRGILKLRGFGHSVKDLTISKKSFNALSQRYICSRLFQYIGPQIRKLTLMSFGVTTAQFEQMKPLLRCLDYLDIDLEMNFNYACFKSIWLVLEELRIRSNGNIDISSGELPNALKVPEFHKLKKLLIETSYRLHANLFKNWHNICPTLTQIIILNEDDYYSQRSQMAQNTTDLANISQFTELKKLHLSFSRTYFIVKLIDEISKIEKLEHFTLDIVHPHDRPREDHIFAEFNHNLHYLGVKLPELREIRFSSIPLDVNRVIDLIKHAPRLEKLTIFEGCFTFDVDFIRNIVKTRRTVFENRPLIQLKLTVAEFNDEAILNALMEEEVMRYLTVVRASKNVINKDYTHKEDTGVRALVRNAHYRRIRFERDFGGNFWF
ncbi:uncharacterized protein LOC116339791 isoform X2 [Contarinia nasturtii]|uniref:uncharacterized protein LOC116339791 isoform X2 n=1 Tax=Contarinia nasturtii TaxID=265458 RepID=UPI0012D43F23|nr:uncharacterized protein LOC116339791 isoform X2 [Contarinia nasturtii]